MIRTLARSLLLLGLAAAIAIAWRSDKILFEWPQYASERYFAKIGYGLNKHRDVGFFVSFDEARPREWITSNPVNAPGTERARGHIGSARKFDGSKYTYIETPALWTALGERYTLALWVNIKEADHDQNICFANFQQRATGFRLEDGRIVFRVPDGEGSDIAVSYPFTAYGHFVHLAAVVEGPSGKVKLYENGRLKAESELVAVSLPSHNIEFGKSRWYTTGEPFVGILDEAIGWKRALSQKEVIALTRRHSSLPVTQVPTLYWRWRAIRAMRDTIPVALKMLDRFNPFLHETKLAKADLPEIQFFFSGKDARHFVQKHDQSLASGRRVKRAANWRHIQAQYEGQTVDAELSLGGADTSYPIAKRPTYILQVPTNTLILGSHFLRLAPPETMSDELSKFELARSPASSGLCRLSINGTFKGVYYYESFDQMGVAPGQQENISNGPRTPSDWPWIFKQSEIIPQSGALGREIADVRHLLARDIFNPWSAREWRWRIRNFKKQNEQSAPAIRAHSLLGTNLSHYFITSDLDVAPLRDSGVIWRSTRPDIIDEQGRVTRPDSGSPVGVDFVADTNGDSSNEDRVLHFRVMPHDRSLPALMIFSRDQIFYNRRQDFHLYYYPAHSEDAPLLLTGGQATGGGIKHRGNTSFWRGAKKPISLRLDAPVNLIGNTTSRYVYLLSGYVDTVKMRNKLVYDLFREWGGAEEQHYAPEITWMEVFINGRYMGVWEACTRIDGNTLGFPAEPRHPASALYKMRASSELFTRPVTREFDQVYPRPSLGRYEDPIERLVAFTSEKPAPDFANGIEEVLNLDNAIDFLLMLNFAGNVDGRTTNYYLGSDVEKGGRFFFIPWDYDHTFDRRAIWLSNHLFNRLINEYPDFMKRAALRWQELRRNSVSEAALDARITHMANQIADDMVWEDRHFVPPEDPRFSGRVEELRNAIHSKLEWMDERFPAPANASN